MDRRVAARHGRIVPPRGVRVTAGRIGVILARVTQGRDGEFDAAIIGGGPAGMSAALVLGRACRRVLLCDSGEPRNEVTQAMHGFLSRDGADPAEFRAECARQLERYDVTVVRAPVVSASRRPPFGLGFGDGSSASARRVVLATGVRDELPSFEGFDAVYGTSAHHCPHCDGWEWRGAAAAVYAPSSGPEYALALAAWTRDVVLLTDGDRAPRGQQAEALRRNGVRVEERRVRRLISRGGKLELVELEGGALLARDALFFHVGIKQASRLPASLGCAVDRDGSVRVGQQQQTSVRGVYAAGDAAQGPQSAISAAAAGAVAGAAVHHDLREEEIRR